MTQTRLIGLAAVAVIAAMELTSGAFTRVDALAAGLTALVLVGRVRPDIAATAVASTALVISAIDGQSSLAVLAGVFVSHGLTAVRSNRIEAAAATLAVVVGFTATAGFDDKVSVGEAVQPIILVMALAVGIHAVRKAIRQREQGHRLQSELVLSHARADLARDVHDVTSHALMAVLTQIRVGRQGVTNDDLVAAIRGLDRATAAAKNAISDLRALTMIIAGSHQSLPSCETLSDVFAQIAKAAENFPLATVTVGKTDGPIDPEVATTAVRVIQQCLANAAAHSPGGAVTVSAMVDGGLLSIATSNSIPLGSEPGSQLGLKIMEQRVAEAGGTFEAGPVGNKFLVRCTLPQMRSK